MHLYVIVVLLLTFASLVLAEFEHFQHSKSGVAHARLPGNGPFEAFQPSNYLRQQLILGPALNVTVREGDAAMMPCIAPHLGDKTVSWIRQRDLAILASGGHVYTSDARITSVHPSSSDLWGLQINPVRLKDEGSYQCQVNTEPKQSRTIVLIVLEQDLKDSPSPPSFTTRSSSTNRITIKIGGASERVVPEGGYINLICSITFQEGGLLPKNVEVAWWHKGIRFQEKNRDPRFTINHITGISAITTELEIQEVNVSDSGSYYCRVEPRYINHQPREAIILRESAVSLKVLPDQLPNAAIPLTPCHLLSTTFLLVRLYI